MSERAWARTHFDSLLEQRSALSSAPRSGFYNPVTGMGTARDKTVYTSYNPIFTCLDHCTLSSLYHGHDLAARIVDVVPDEELRLPFQVTVEGDEKAERLIKDEFERLEVRKNLLEGRKWGRAFGGGATIIGAQDGAAAKDPLDWRRVRSPIYWLRTVDRRYLWPSSYYQSGPKNGRPERYWINDSNPGGSRSFEIHESRLILWGGAPTAQLEREMNNSWDLSVLDRCWQPLKAFETVYKGVELLIVEGPQAVYKVKGLFDKIVAGKEPDVLRRFELIELFRSALRAVVLDADGSEEFERQQVTYSGTPEILNQMQLRLCATSQIPMMVLFGQAPGGLGVTGENDLRWFFDRTASSQLNELTPRIKQTARGVLMSHGYSGSANIDVVYEPLWRPTDKEAAEARLYTAQADEKYVENNILFPEEVVLSRFKDKGKWSTEWSGVSRKERAKVLKKLLKELEAGEPIENTISAAPKPDPAENPPGQPGQPEQKAGQQNANVAKPSQESKPDAKR